MTCMRVASKVLFVLAIASAPAAAKEAPPTIGAGHMQHCPTMVDGAKTEIKELPDGVELTVTHKSPAKTDEIRVRARHAAEAAKRNPETVEHQGNGHGGGGLGRCEVVLKDTVVTVEDVDGGAKLTVKPQRPIDVEWLKKETRERHETALKPPPKKKPAAK
jgi:hypothetical protein